MTSLLERLQAASENPSDDTSAFVLANLDNILAGRPPELRRVLATAAVPHIWNETLLSEILDDDLAIDSAGWLARLCELSVVERIPDTDRFAVHEVSRLALRAQLFREGRLEAISRRTLLAMGNVAEHASASDEIERLYHQLVAEPEFGANVLEATSLRWHNDGVQDALKLLASALSELHTQLSAPARAMALFVRSQICRDTVPASQILEDATAAAELFERLGQKRQQALARDLAGDARVALGDVRSAEACYQLGLTLRRELLEIDSSVSQWQRDLSVSFEKLGDLATAQGNLPEAQRLFGESLRIAQRLAESDPANAAWQRDLWVSYSRMADLSEQLGQAAEAKGWWKKSYDTLAGMKQRGLHVSPEDEGFLERLRSKAGG